MFDVTKLALVRVVLAATVAVVLAAAAAATGVLFAFPQLVSGTAVATINARVIFFLIEILSLGQPAG